MQMLRFNKSPMVTMEINEAAEITKLTVNNGSNLILNPQPFARLEYYKPLPAFTNEWIHPLCVEEPRYVYASAATSTEEGFTISFGEEDLFIDFAVEAVEEGLIITMKNVRSEEELPASIRFACLSLKVDEDTAVTGMALEPIVQGISLPGIYSEQAALAYAHTGYDNRKWAIIGAPKKQMQQIMKEVTRKYTENIPWMSCTGAFASENRKVQGSYFMSYGDYLDGSLKPDNLEEWIQILHAIGLTQVDFHGAEAKNFSFGDFEPYRKIYPEGRKSLKAVVDRLHEEGIDSILHTYSALISVNSSQVTPVPDPDLGYNRLFTLAEDIDAEAIEIPILEDTSEISLVHTSYYNSSTYVVWDNEIIQFTALEDHKLCGCIRGALGTEIAAHAAGTKGRNLKRMYNIFVPDVGGKLFDQVARKTAECANECGFDGYYFDALEGVSTLEGNTFMEYWSTQFAYLVAKYTNRPVGMEMSTMCHNLWYIRSRMEAWDRSARAHKQYLKRHAEVNRLAQERSMMPQNLGWWYYGKNLPSAPSAWERITTDVYDLMGKLAAAYDFSMSFQGLTVQDYQASEELKRYGDRIRRWEKLRLRGELTPEERAKISDVECYMKPHGIYEARYLEDIVTFEQGQAEVVFENPFENQQPFLIRLEPLYSKTNNQVYQKEEAFDVNSMLDPSSEKLTADTGAYVNECRILNGVTAEELSVFTSRTVSAELREEETIHGKSMCFSAKAQRDIGVARFERCFDVPLNISGQYGCGVWVYGDGRGEILNLQLRSHRLYSGGLDEKIITIDFVGWKYFELVEAGVTESMHYLWPYYYRQLDLEDELKPMQYEPETNDWPDSMYITKGREVEGNPCHLTSETPDFTRIAFASVWLNNLPKDELCEVKIADWHTFFTAGRAISDISVRTEGGSEQICVKGTLPQDSIAEYSDGINTPGLGEAGHQQGSWFTSDANSVPLMDCSADGMVLLKSGKNRLKIQANCQNGTRMRIVCGVRGNEPIVSR